MVVVCPECNTRFSLDESRIPGAAANVRCSRCRHVFRIARDGQVIAPDLAPPSDKTQEASPQAEVREEVPFPLPPEPGENGPPPQKEGASGEEVQPQPFAMPEEVPAPPEMRRPWLWIPILGLAAALLGALAWLTWQGNLPAPLKPLTDIVQRWKGKQPPAQQPAKAPGPEAGAPAAPIVVTPPPPLVPAADLRDLSVEWAQAHYQGLVNDKGGGQVLLIQGEILNKGKSSRGPIRLKAILTDSQHRPLREEVVYTGTTLTDTEAKTLTPEEIKGWLAKPGGRSQDRVLKPGGKQPFTAVFFGVPDNLAETQSGFQLVVLEGPVTAD